MNIRQITFTLIKKLEYVDKEAKGFSLQRFKTKNIRQQWKIKGRVFQSPNYV